MSQDATNSKKNQVALADYVEDMHVVEVHIEEALDRQLTMFADQPEVHAAIVRFHDMVKAQRDALAALKNDMPEEPIGNTVKDVGSALLGKAAGLIDKVRSESSSKALRDDYTAFNLAAVSYGMLYTSAAALGDTRVSELARKHLRGYAAAVQDINSLIPAVVVHDLAHDGLDVDASVVDSARAAIDEAWKTTTN